MTFNQLFFSKIVLTSLAVAAILAIILTFLPLVGTLGFEYSIFTAFIMAFISVFLASELANIELRSRIFGQRVSDRSSAILLINFIILTVLYLIGLFSSLIKQDCYIMEGTVFFLLIPAVTVFFSTSLGLLTGFIVKRRGFLLGALILLAIISYSLWKLYSGLPLFLYNPVIGFFPGPLYDEAVPVTQTLVIYRAVTVLWGVFLLLLLKVMNGISFQRARAFDFISLVVVVIALIISYSYQHNIGFSYSRDYVTEDILPGSIETDNFIIYYDPGSSEAGYIDLIAEDHEWRYKQLSEYLNLNSSGKIRSYIYPDIETRKKIVGAGETTIANPVHKEIHMVYSSFPHPILKHELVHVMAGDFGSEYLKISPKIGLLEGIAVAADWNGNGYTRHQYSKSLIEKNMAPDIEDIVGFGFWYAPPQVSYTLMGSFSRYLIDTYGIENFKTLYKSGDFSVYGKSLGELSAEWKEFLEGVYTPEETTAIAESRFSEPSIFEATCPRRVATLKNLAFTHFRDDDYYRAIKQFEEALGYSGGDAVLLNGLSYSNYYGGNYEQVAIPAETTEHLPLVDRHILQNIRANALWQTDDSAKALVVFQALRSKPLPDELKRELDIKISAINRGGVTEEKIRDFFGTRQRTLQVAALEELIQEHPDYAPAYYLLGRMFFNNEQFDKALPYLSQARELGLGMEKLTLENLRILGIVFYTQGRYEEAQDAYTELVLLDESGQREDYSLDFIDRSIWASGLRDEEESGQY